MTNEERVLNPEPNPRQPRRKRVGETIKRPRRRDSSQVEIPAEWLDNSNRPDAGNLRATSTSKPLVVLTYNILCKKYATNHLFGSYCPPPLLSWDYRSPRILNQLTFYNADIICLQEVQANFLSSHLLPRLLSSGYTTLSYLRSPPLSTNTTATDPDGVTLSFKSDTFRPVLTRSIRFGDRVEEALAEKSTYWRTVKDRDDGAVIVLLEVIDGDGDGDNPSYVLAASTHLYWDPSWPDIKALQAHFLCAEIAKVLQSFINSSGSGRNVKEKITEVQGGSGSSMNIHTTPSSSLSSIPIVIGGDFNSMPPRPWLDIASSVDIDSYREASGVYHLLTQLTTSLPREHRDHPVSSHIRRQRQVQLQHEVQQSAERKKKKKRRTAVGDARAAAAAATAAVQLQSEMEGIKLHSSGLAFDSAAALAWGCDPPVTNKTNSFSGCLDYVFVSKGDWNVVEALDTLSYPFPPPLPSPRKGVNSNSKGKTMRELISTVAPMPNEDAPSDHLPLCFKLERISSV